MIAVAKNSQIKTKLGGEENVIEKHFDKLANPNEPGGGDPNNRNKWKDDIKRHINEMKKQIDKLKGDRNKKPFEDKVKDFENRVNEVQ